MTEETKEAIIYKPGMIVKIHQKIKEMNTKGEEKERIQIFEGTVIAAKHGKEAGATITVRKMSEGVGVDKIEVVRQLVVRRAKLGFLRNKDFKRKMKDTKKEAKKEVKK